jgi:hypothetical protein
MDCGLCYSCSTFGFSCGAKVPTPGLPNLITDCSCQALIIAMRSKYLFSFGE